MSEFCLCQSQKSYQHCCQPLHLQQIQAITAEHLMRSRYVAYATQNIAYLVETTLPAQQHLLDQAAMLQWSKETKWAGLDIIQHQAKVAKNHAQVEFKAYFIQDAQMAYHHERSSFVLVDGCWYFLDPTVPQCVSLKQLCICGSNKKFKHCCAAFL